MPVDFLLPSVLIMSTIPLSVVGVKNMLLHTHACTVRSLGNLGNVGFVMDKEALVNVSPSTSVSPPSAHSTNCCALITIIIARGWYSRPASGLRSKWTRCHSTTRMKKRTKLVFGRLVVQISA
jgi:hypothetical protein